jgi:hypothetical protein
MSCEDFIRDMLDLENDISIIKNNVYKKRYLRKMIPARMDMTTHKLSSEMVEHNEVDISSYFLEKSTKRLIEDAQDCQSRNMSIPLNPQLESQYTREDIKWLRRLYPQLAHNFLITDEQLEGTIKENYG